MEYIHYTDSRCAWYHRAETNSLDLFPAELAGLASFTKVGKVNVIDSWNGVYGMFVRDNGDMWDITIDEMETAHSSRRYTVKAEIKKTTAVHLRITKLSVLIKLISLPRHLNDKVAWALGAKKYQKVHSLEALEEYYDTNYMDYQTMLDFEEIQPGPCYAVQKAHYGKCTAVVVNDGYGNTNDGRYYIDGYLTRDEAIKILEKAIQLNGWYFSYPAKVQYVLDNI